MRRTGKLANVIREMRKANLDILGLTEVRWKDGGDFMSEGIRVIYTEERNGQSGVAVLLNEKIAGCVTKIESYKDRILVVEIKAYPVDIKIIQVYMPTTASEEEEVEEIYEVIEEELKKTRGKNYTVMMGDWNASVGEGREGNCVGNYGLGKRNERGQKLVDFCKRQKMVITNTWFQQEKRRRYTWKSPGDEKRYQIDYIIVKERYRNSVKTSKAMPGADADTDHNLVAMKSYLNLKLIRRKKQTIRRWDKEKLKTETKRMELTQRIENRVEEQQEEQKEEETIEERWRKIRDIIVEETTEIIGYQKGTAPRKPWITGEMILEMEERRKWRHQSTEEAKKEYRRLNNKLRRTTEKAREEWWENQCKEIEELQRKGRYDKIYEIVKKSTKNQMQKGGIGVQDKDGAMIQDPQQVKERWKEYIEELYQTKSRPKELNQEKKEDEDEETGPEILKEEVVAAIADMKNNKSEGIDSIPAEILKELGIKQ